MPGSLAGQEGRVTRTVSATTLRPADLTELKEAVRAHPRVIARGGASKWALADPPPGAVVLETTALSGVVDYDPAEFTITVRAGTRMAELEALLRRHGQYLPFDPLLAEAGATAGGTVATGVSGPCRLRHGGVRDFVVGVAFVDGDGRLVRGGGRVVKNAAGFDFPKLLCGSRGRLGVIAELTFKVFPLPEAHGTARFTFPAAAHGAREAAAAVRALLRSPLEPEAVELAAPGVWQGGYTLLVRVAGPAKALPQRLDRVEQLLGRSGERITGEDEHRLWRDLRELRWAAGAAPLLRLYSQPGQIEALDAALAHHGALRLFSQGGNAVWALLPAAPDWERLAADLARAGVVCLCWRGGPPGRRFLVPPPGGLLAERVKAALDPPGRFPGFEDTFGGAAGAAGAGAPPGASP